MTPSRTQKKVLHPAFLSLPKIAVSEGRKRRRKKVQCIFKLRPRGGGRSLASSLQLKEGGKEHREKDKGKVLPTLGRERGGREGGQCRTSWLVPRRKRKVEVGEEEE